MYVTPFDKSLYYRLIELHLTRYNSTTTNKESLLCYTVSLYVDLLTDKAKTGLIFSVMTYC